MHELHWLSFRPLYVRDKTLSSSLPVPLLETLLMNLHNTVTSYLPADCLTSIVGNRELWLQCASDRCSVSQQCHMGRLCHYNGGECTESW